MAEPIAANAAPAPAQPAAEPAANVTPAANAAPAPANGTPASESPAANGSEPTKPLGDKGVQELIDQRRKRQQAEQEAAYWRGVAEGGGRQPQQPQKPQAPQGPPVLEQFENYDDYLVAKAKFEVQQDIVRGQQAAQRQNVVRTFQDRVRKAAEKNPDILSVLEDRSIPISAPMADAIQESELGPEIAYHLKQNPMDAERIAYLSPVAAIREIGKIEARLSAPQPQTTQRISQAPEPIKALGGGGSVTEPNLETMPMEEFIRKRNADTKPR